jgi:FSR family fosmidomycin resistance protein-like MFS transporter
MKKIVLPVSLGLAHGISDCSAGLILGSLTATMTIYGVGSMVLLYNILAFGAQPLAGLLTDKLQSPKMAALTGLGLMVVAVGMFFVNPFIAVILAGLASALFHVGGGALALCSTPGKAAGAGLFSSPGVAGLAIGGYLAVNEIFPAVIIIFLLGIITILIAISKKPELPYDLNKHDEGFDKHDFIMLFMLLAIALRSAVWNIFQYIEQGEVTNIILISLSAAGGKIFGGYAGDFFGWRRYSFAALTLAIPMLLFGEMSFYWLLPGIALLQSVTPILVTAIYRKLPALPATTAGLSFGLAIAAGGVPFITGMDMSSFSSPLFITGTIVLTMVLIMLSLKNRAGKSIAR